MASLEMRRMLSYTIVLQCGLAIGHTSLNAYSVLKRMRNSRPITTIDVNTYGIDRPTHPNGGLGSQANIMRGGIVARWERLEWITRLDRQEQSNMTAVRSMPQKKKYPIF